MDGTVTAFLPISGDPDVLSARIAGDPQRWLPAPAEPVAADEWLVHLRAGPAVYPVVCHVGGVWRDRGNLWRPVIWRPRGGDTVGRLTDRVLPELVSELGLVAGTPLTLTLSGTYEPPAGPIGVLGDRALLHRLADTTARRFLTDIARRLNERVPAAADAGGI